MPGSDRQHASPPAHYLEPEQLTSRTCEAVPRATLSTAAKAGLLALRAFALVVSLMVAYTFLSQL